MFRILESEGVTEKGTLYKVSPSKFVLVFGSRTAKEKLAGTEIQWIGKKQVKIFPAGVNPMILPSKISFHGSIQKEKVVLRYKCKTRHMLCESCREVTPTPEDSVMAFIEQSGTPRQSPAPAEPESSVEICSSRKSQLKTSPPVEEAGRENFSIGGTSSGSDSG